MGTSYSRFPIHCSPPVQITSEPEEALYDETVSMVNPNLDVSAQSADKKAH